MVVISIIMITLIIFEHESDLRGNEHFLSSSKNKAWKDGLYDTGVVFYY